MWLRRHLRIGLNERTRDEEHVPRHLVCHTIIRQHRPVHYQEGHHGGPQALVVTAQTRADGQAVPLVVQRSGEGRVAVLLGNRQPCQRQETVAQAQSRTPLYDRFDCQSQLLLLALNKSDDKRFPVGKVLVQRSDADSRDLGHPVGEKASQRLFGQNASSRFKTESQTRTPCRQVHDHRQPFVVNPGACAGCGDCINQCREHAINLSRNPGTAPSADAQELE